METKVKLCTFALVANDVTNSVKSFQLSKKYVNRLLRIGTFNIMYRRIEIPESEIEPKSYENVEYAIFKRKSKNKLIRNYHAFVGGFIDAFEKDYLKDIFMFINDKNTQKTMESYNFKVKYNKTDTKSGVKPVQIKSATIQFLQALANISGKKRWNSEDVEVAVEFTYNDGVPYGYQPPHFFHADHPVCLKLNEERRVAICSINTGFHKVSCYGRGQIFAESRASTPAQILELIEDEDEMIVDEIDISNSDMGEAPKKKRKMIDRDDALLDNSGGNETNENITILSSEEYVSCHCKWDLPKEYETSRCTKCLEIVHLPCQGYLSVNAIKGIQFQCIVCTNSKVTKSMSLVVKFRIILFAMSFRKAVPMDLLQMASEQEKRFIAKRLDELEIYSKKSKSNSDINLTKLKEAMYTTFSNENSQFFE